MRATVLGPQTSNFKVIPFTPGKLVTIMKVQLAAIQGEIVDSVFYNKDNTSLVTPAKETPN